jgi:hypothetical protein
MLIKPSNGLDESLFLRKLFMLHACIASDSETMHHSTIQIDLVWLLRLYEDGLRLVSFLSREDRICLSSGDREWPLDSTQLGLFDETWVGEVPDVDSFSSWHESHGVFGALHHIS